MTTAILLVMTGGGRGWCGRRQTYGVALAQAQDAGLFVEPVRGSVEMRYQNDRPFVFDRAKFDRAFFPATP